MLNRGNKSRVIQTNYEWNKLFSKIELVGKHDLNAESIAFNSKSFTITYNNFN